MKKIKKILIIGLVAFVLMTPNVFAYETQIDVQRTVEITKTQIPYNTQTIQDPNVYEGITTVSQVGVFGEITHTKIGRTLNRKYFQTSLVDVITAQPIDEIVNVGVKPYPTMLSNDKRFIFPCNGVVTSTDKPGSHENFEAVDVANSIGTFILAPADGIITMTEEFGGYGNCLQIDSGNYHFLMGHLSGFNVIPGQTVKKGDVVGFMGSTGNSTGSHLHLEAYMEGVKKYIPDIFDLELGESV